MDKKYTEDLIKGKITEIIFEEMFRVSEEFIIIPLGYEHTTPILAQFQHHAQIKEVLANIRSAPDFALVSQDKKSIFLVEVKYRNGFTNQNILQIAKETITRWNPCFLFVVSKEGFYFSPCSTILSKNGEIEKLRESWITKEIQQKYYSLLREFIK